MDRNFKLRFALLGGAAEAEMQTASNRWRGKRCDQEKNYRDPSENPEACARRFTCRRQSSMGEQEVAEKFDLVWRGLRRRVPGLNLLQDNGLPGMLGDRRGDEQIRAERRHCYKDRRARYEPFDPLRGTGILDAEIAERMVQTLADGQLQEIAGSGHPVPLDKPDEFRVVGDAFV